MERYNKPPLTYSEQIDLLESRGLNIGDKNRAISKLKNISYYNFDGNKFLR